MPAADMLRAWLRASPVDPGGPLLPNARGGHLSRDGVQYLLAKHVEFARQTCASLRKKRVSPHVLRHSTAMDLLQHGVDHSVIALWLGHESTETTQIYLAADLALKEKHTLYFQHAGDGWPIASVARNDGSGSCILNQALRAETYGGRFSENGERVLWIEYGVSGSEEGWSADPSTCAQKAKFGDWVLGFAVSGDFVVFEGGDTEDSTSYLQYARLPLEAASTPVIPLIVEEQPRYPFVTLLDGGVTHLVYAVSGDTPERQGLFAHGPLETALPSP